MRTISLVAAACLSVPVSIIGIFALQFSDPNGDSYSRIIRWGFVAATFLLPAFALILFSVRLLAWYLRMAAFLVYAGEFFIVWGDCARNHCGLARWVPLSWLLPAIGALISPQVWLTILIVILVEYAYRWDRQFGARWEGEVR
jgi:hypothetical protein